MGARARFPVRPSAHQPQPNVSFNHMNLSRLSHLYRSTTTGVLLAAGCLQLRAADDPPPAGSVTVLDKFAVTVERPASLTVPSLTAARTDLALAPGATGVVDAESYLRGRASTLADTFALAAGVVAQSRFGSDEARLSIRGSGLQRTFHGRGLRVLQDGVPINLADGSFDMQAIEPLSAAYIAVWRGGNAPATGASTLGGVIDYVSRTGGEAPSLLARLETGSWGYLRAHAAGGGVSGAADGYASFTHQQQDGFRRHARQSNQRLFANGAMRWSKTAETRVFLTGVITESELPGNLTKAQLNADPRQAATGNLALDQHRDFKLMRIATKTSVQTGDTAWDFTAAWTYKDLDHPIFQVIDQLSNDLVLGASFAHAGEVFGRANRLRAGVLFSRGVMRAANFVNAAGRRGAPLSAATQTAANVEAFAEDQIFIGRGLTLVLGLGAAMNRRDNNQNLGATPDYALDYRRLMPKIGLRWDGRRRQFYVNVSGSHEPPSFSETLTLNTAREAQTATSWEIGTRGVHGAFRWDASLYQAALRHELLTLDDDNNPSTPSATVNANDTAHAGVELAAEIDLLGAPWDAKAAPASRLVLRAAWTWGRFRFDDDPRYGNNTLAGLPPHLIRGELAWESSAGWYGGPTFEWVPEETPIDFRNTFAADAHAIAGFRVGRRTPKGVSWFAEVRNIFGKRHAATTGVIETAGGADQAQFLPGDGRGIFGGIEYRWR